jgi:hypothetical protein
MGQAIAAIAGNFDVDDAIGPVRFNGFNREPGVGERVGDGVGIERLRGEEIGVEPFQTDFHEPMFLVTRTDKSNWTATISLAYRQAEDFYRVRFSCRAASLTRIDGTAGAAGTAGWPVEIRGRRLRWGLGFGEIEDLLKLIE